MNLIPQQARDRVGTLLDPLALLLIRWRVRPNLITTVGTLVVVGSAAAFALGEVRWGGWLLLVAGLFDMVDGRVARQGGTTTTFGAFYDSTLDRVGEALLFGGIAFATAVTVVERVVYVARVAGDTPLRRPARPRDTVPGRAPALPIAKGP